jgi:hypothetical protein
MPSASMEFHMQCTFWNGVNHKECAEPLQVGFLSRRRGARGGHAAEYLQGLPEHIHVSDENLKPHLLGLRELRASARASSCMALCVLRDLL